MEILYWILFGIMGGWIASVIYENRDRSDVFKNILLGVLGTVLGVLFVNALGYGGISVQNTLSVLSASIFVSLFIGLRRILNKKEGVWQS